MLSPRSLSRYFSLFSSVFSLIRARKEAGESKDTKAYSDILRSRYDFEQHFVYEGNIVGSRFEIEAIDFNYRSSALCWGETFASSLIKGRRIGWDFAKDVRFVVVLYLVECEKSRLSKHAFRFSLSRSNVVSIYIVDYITNVKPLN